MTSSSVQLARIFSMLALCAGCGGRAERSSGTPYEAGGEGNVAGAAGTFGGASAVDGGASAVAGLSGDAGAVSETCSPGNAPLRRLTRAEYLKTVTDLAGDVSDITAALPEELGPFPVANQALFQTVDQDQVSAYFQIAKALADRVAFDSNALSSLAACAGASAPDTACARTTIEAFASKAFRRAPTTQEVDGLLALHTSISNGGGDFATATRAVIAAILQAPAFLYRVEWGTGEGPRPGLSRLTGDEMATRLSYLFWGSAPDAGLRAAAQSGALLEPAGIAKQAQRLLDDPRSRAGLASFFDDFLNLDALPQLHRFDPDYSPDLAETVHEATQRSLASQIFDHDQAWPAVLTARTAFVNGSLSSLYGLSGIVGDDLREVSLDSTQRLGLLTQPGVLMADQSSDFTNPTQRGYRIIENILCRDIPEEPPDLAVTLVDDPGAVTTRQRWLQQTSSAACVACHRDMDQLGFAFENYDTMGRYRTQDNGIDIDARVNVTGVGPTNGPIELVKRLAELPEAQACFAQRLAEFGLGKALVGDPGGECLKRDIARRFQAAGYNVRQLLLNLTQTDAFRYLPKDR